MRKEAWKLAQREVEIRSPAVMSKGKFCVLEASQEGIYEMMAEM